MMEIKILLLEDNARIRKNYKSLLEEEARDRQIQLAVADYGEAEDAVSRLLDEKPEYFDLIMTDINLVESDSSDRSGLAVARFARRRSADIALVGLSAIFDDGALLDAEIALFDKWWSKSVGFNQIDQLVQDTILRAMDHASGTSSDTAPLQVTSATEEDYRAQGYIQEYFEPTSSNFWSRPVGVWRKTSGEGVELEVYGCKSLYSWGDTLVEARENLEALIEDYRDTFDQPAEKFGTDVLQARDFAIDILGYRPVGAKA
jgi:CheY-like chemotaxis protein